MSRVRVLVGTRKGAFILTSDGKREKWDVSGPHFAGWEIYHVKGSPADPNRIYASQSSGWFGQMIQRSNDGGKTWEPVGNKFAYDGVPGTHQWYDGTPHPWEFKRVWHLEPSLTDPDTVYAGVEDAALFRLDRWRAELAGAFRACADHGSGPHWQPGAGGMCLHTILLDPSNPSRMFIAISAAGAFRTDDGGETWKPINHGLRVGVHSRSDAEVGHCVHRHRDASVAAGRAVHAEALGCDAQRRRRRLVARGQRQSADGLRLSRSTFMRTSRRRSTSCRSRATRSIFRPTASCACTAAATGGNEWEALTNGLPQQRLLCECAARCDGGGLARLVRRLLRHDRRAGVRFGRRGR